MASRKCQEPQKVVVTSQNHLPPFSVRTALEAYLKRIRQKETLVLVVFTDIIPHFVEKLLRVPQ